MTGPILPGESLATIRSIRPNRPTLALLPGESQALADLARLSYLQGVADFIAANDLPPDWQPDPEDLSPWWLID